MIGYVTLGTNDLARGAAFYDAIAAEMGVAPDGWQMTGSSPGAFPAGPPGSA